MQKIFILLYIESRMGLRKLNSIKSLIFPLKNRDELFNVDR